MNILVSGATGYIGRHLSASLVEDGHIVHALCRPDSDTSCLDHRIAVFTYKDDPRILGTYIGKKCIEGVFHLASIVQNGLCRLEDIPTLVRANVELGTVLIDAASRNGARYFINTGTFWQNRTGCGYDPVNLYAATKQAFSDIIALYRNSTDLIAVTLKLNDTYGPIDPRRKIVNLWLDLVATGGSLDMTPGTQEMDIVYIDDVVMAYKILMKHLVERSQVDEVPVDFFISSSRRVTLRELANIFATVNSVRLNINWGVRPFAERDILIPSPVGTVLPGWAETVSLEEGLRRVFLTRNENRDGVRN